MADEGQRGDGSPHFQGAVISVKCNYDPVTQTSTSGILPSDSRLSVQLWNAKQAPFLSCSQTGSKALGEGLAQGESGSARSEGPGPSRGPPPSLIQRNEHPKPNPAEACRRHSRNQWFENHQEVGQPQHRSVLALCLSVLAHKTNSRPGA